MLTEQAANRAGSQEWHWRASFEAFDSYPRADVNGGQVPDGTYRFVVEGHFNDGTTKLCDDDRTTLNVAKTAMGDCYQLTSKPFTVSPWGGITAGDLKRTGGQASFVIRTPERTITQDISEALEQ